MNGMIALIDALAQSNIGQSNLIGGVLVFALVLTAVCVNWRLSAVMLGLISVCNMFLLFTEVDPLLAFTRTIVGGCVALILLRTAWRQRNDWQFRYPRIGMVLLTIMLLLVLTQTAAQSRLASPLLTFAMFALIVLGIGLLVSAEHLLYSLIGLFLLLMGGDLIAAVLTQSAGWTMLFATLQLTLALITAWIATPAAV